MRSDSSGMSPVQALSEDSSTTGFGWDHPDIPGKTHPNPLTVDMHVFKIIIMIKNPG